MPRGILSFAFVAGLHGVAAPAAEPTALVKPLEVRKVFGNGKHNAFTALAKWHDAYWLAFRTATNHGSGDGDILLLRSPDGKKWDEVHRFDILPDDRDPQFLVTEKRLFLYDPALKGSHLTTYVVHTEDGVHWSKPQVAYEPRYILWKPVAHQGRFWAAAHKKDEGSGGKGRDVHLVASEDGLKWEKVSTIRAGNWESETTLLFQGERAIAFLRQKYGSPQASIHVAEAPYKEWKSRPAPVSHFSGHCVHTIRGVTYLLSRGLDPTTKKNGHVIYIYEGDGSLTPYCVLPAAGDYGYAEVAVAGDNMLVSFYSGHETDKPAEKTNIYVAVVPLRK